MNINAEGNLDCQSLREDYRHRLFEEYLPFWEKGGYDQKYGGFLCYLHDDGRVETPLKDIWYQGRGIWSYAFLYNELDKDPKWLERATRSRDFMVEHMSRGDGTWETTVDRKGKPARAIESDRGPNIYGSLFASAGLLQLARATQCEEDLELARKSIRKGVERYEDPDYTGITLPGVNTPGLRAQGHSFMFVWILPQLLELDPDPWFAEVLEEHLDALENRFWNPELGIINEYLHHDYRRIPEYADHHYPGHAIEGQWMAMAAALRKGEPERFHRFVERFRRLVEMNWDYVFGGLADQPGRVLGSEREPAGIRPEMKTMWAQTEVLIGCLLIWEKTGEDWALEWYGRGRDFLLKHMTTPHGFWHQTVDRRGKPVPRPGFSSNRKENFHHPRYLMMNLLTWDRILG